MDGATIYKVYWLENFWKCNVFMNDALYSGGFKPAVWSETGRQKYVNAGRLHSHGQQYLKEISAAAAVPGNTFQKFGGSGSDESHTAILSTMVEKLPPTKENLKKAAAVEAPGVYSIDEFVGKADAEVWIFGIIGATSDRARDERRSYLMKKGTNKTYEAALTIRFFQARKKRR